MISPKPRPKSGPDALGVWPKNSGPTNAKSQRRASQTNSTTARIGKVPLTLKPAPPWEKETAK